ncbi:MAG TPA: hypothetical protein VGK74_07175 [Symbiobacteriaceae bacterium]
MQNPVREFIRLTGRWVSERRSGHSADVFVPGAWAGESLAVREASGEVRPVDLGVTPGGWNHVETNGPVDGARLEAANPLQITGLEVSPAGEKSLAARVRLSETPGAPKALLTLVFTATAPDGRQVGGQEVTVSTRTRDLTLEIPLSEPARGSYLLKVSLCMDDRVLDNARQEIEL